MLDVLAKARLSVRLSGRTKATLQLCNVFALYVELKGKLNKKNGDLAIKYKFGRCDKELLIALSSNQFAWI